jgi:hypothetical protein
MCRILFGFIALLFSGDLQSLGAMNMAALIYLVDKYGL